MSTFAESLAKAKTPGSAVLNAWRANYGPEATGRISNLNETRQNLTVQELSNIIGGGAISSAGPVVSEQTAMRVSAVYACVALIAGAISTLPMPIYERTPSGRQKISHPYYWLLNEQPDSDISAAVFWEYMASARLFHGDAFAEIVRSSYRSDKVVAIRAHHPLRVTPFRDSAGELFYRIMPLTGPQYVLSPSDMLHVPSLGYDGLTSPSPITYAARQAVGTSIATADYNGRFFSNGARPDFALMTDGNINKDQAELLRSTWHDRHGGAANAHLPAILTGGLKVQQLTMSSADSQILATCSWNLEEICRVLGVPPFMVGSTEKSTSWGTGQENMGRGFVKYTLLRDLRKFEQEINRKFWPARETYFVEFDVSGIERGDMKSENESLRVALGRAGEPGWLSVNEVRHLKLLPPIEGGDTVATGVMPKDPNAQQAADQKQADNAKSYMRETVQAFASAQKEPTINVHVDAPVVNMPAQQISISTKHIDDSLGAVLEKMAASQTEIVKAIEDNMNIIVNVHEQTAPVVNVTVEAPSVSFEATVPAAQVTVIDNHPVRAVQTVQRDANDEITATVTTYEK